MKHIIIWVAALAAIAIGLLVYESDLLWKSQELNLFLYTSLFFKEQMVVAAGMLTYLGTWFTQFFYHPWMGVSLLCCWWLLLMFLLKKTFSIPSKWAPLMLIPVCLLLLTDVDMGYWLYMLKLRGHFFVATIGTTTVVALLWVFRKLPDKYWLRCLWMALACVVGYPLIGIYALAATLLMGIWSWRLMSRGKGAIYSLIAIVCAIAIPLIFYRQVYYETNLSNIYYVGLPLYYLTEEYHQYYIPFYLLALFMVVMVCLPLSCAKKPLESKNAQEDKTLENKKPQEDKTLENNVPLESNKTSKGKKSEKYLKSSKNVIPPKTNNLAKSSKPKKSDKTLKKGNILAWCAQLLTAAIMVWGVVHFWFKDENFHHELRMQHLIQQNDWEGVIQEALTQQDEPTRAIVMMRNLALWRLGRQGDEMFLYRNGSKRINAPFDMRMMLVTGQLIYYQYGMLNYCNRLSTELGVEFGWRAENYKYLALCALLNGEKRVASKYINILKKTLFFDEWAEWADNLLKHPDLIAKERELEPITHMLHYPDVLSGDNGFVESFLMKQLANSSYPADPVYQEQSLLATLYMKDPELFWYHFNIFVKLHPNGPIPIAYQQAAYLYGKLENRPNIDNGPFSQVVKDEFNRFMNATPNYEGMDIEEARKAMYPLYGNSYYYDHYLMSNLPEY